MIGKRSLLSFLGGVGLALAIALGVSMTAGAAGPAAPTDDNRPMQIQAITPNPEMLFVPITPCRIVDTRSAGGTITSGQVRNYYVGGTVGFAPQGGKSGGCGIPTGAQAVVATFSAVNPTNGGYMRVWPAGQAEPQATLLLYAKNSAAVGGTVKLRSDAGTDMSVKNYGGPTHLVIDVSGYYIQQLQAYISSSGTVLDQSGRLVSATNTSAGQYTLEWDRDISSCSGQASSDVTGHISSVYTSGTISYIYVVNNAGVYENYWTNVLINC